MAAVPVKSQLQPLLLGVGFACVLILFPGCSKPTQKPKPTSRGPAPSRREESQSVPLPRSDPQESKRASPPPLPTAPTAPTTPTSQNAAHGLPLFIEVISESSNAPLPSPSAALAVWDRKLQGYLYEPATEHSVASLFPALGEDSDRPYQDDALLIGFRVVQYGSVSADLSSETPFCHKHLAASAAVKETFDGETLPRDELRALRAFYAAERPKLPIEVEAMGLDVSIRCDGASFRLQPGQSQVIHEATTTGPEPLYHRWTATLYGPVAVASFDALHEWNRSNGLMATGPYEDALAAVENVLLANPAHEGALRRWSKLQRWLASGVAPSTIQVTFHFPKETNAEALLQQCKEDPMAWVYLSQPDGPAEVAIQGARIDAKTVKIFTPSGTFRVTANVPGFQRFQQEIEVHGHAQLAAPLEVQP